MTLKKTRVLVCAPISAVAVLAAFYFYEAITMPRRSVDRFIKEADHVEIGKTKLADFRKQMDLAGLSAAALPCGERECGYALQVDNTILNKLRLAPVTVIDCSVTFKDGIASETRIMVGVGARDRSGRLYDDKAVVVRQSAVVPAACHSEYDLTVKRADGAVHGDAASVRMDQCVSRAARSRALAINSACLTRIGGCKTLQQILPQVLARH